MVATIAHMAAAHRVVGPRGRARGRNGLSPAFGHEGELDYAEAVLEAAGATIEAGVGDDGAAGRDGTGPPHHPRRGPARYLADHGLDGCRSALATGIMDVVAGAIPGIRDILVLGKIKQIERYRLADVSSWTLRRPGTP